MSHNFLMYFAFVILILFGTSCDSGPKVIESNNNGNSTDNLVRDPHASGHSSAAQTSNSNNASGATHHVEVKEVLDTDKYSYLRVVEGKEEFWVAVLKQDVEIGKTYSFEGGLLKRNFYSQEYDRIFETVYLVSRLLDPSSKSEKTPHAHKGSNSEAAVDLEVGNIKLAQGSVKIADILSQKEQYGGKKVKVTGKCVKLNPNIMNRNWVHLSDGSGKALVITTNEIINLGSIVNLEGMISLDRDFGAGYRYDIIMEGATLQ